MASIINATTTNGVAVQGDNSGSLQLQTNNGTTAVTIDTSQNVGIGTTSPASKIDINTNSSTGTTDMITLSGLDNGSAKQTYGVIRMGIENNTANSEQGNIVLQTVESGTVRDRININGSGYISFANGGTERMRIGSSGQLFYNCTAEPSSSVKGWGLFLTGSGGSTGQYVASATTNSGNFDHYYFYSVNGLAGFIRTNGTTCTYNSVSDVRLKENIVDAPSALATVNDIKVRSFDWKNSQDHVDYGFIAQELNDVAPQAVAEGETTEEGEIKTPWAIDTSMLIPMLVKSIQELKAELDATKAEVAALKGVA